MPLSGHPEIPAKELFRIGEVSRLTDTKAFVLRYWETEFPMLQPVKTPAGHRLYRREDVEMVLRIKRLLYDEGFTIAGARRHLRDSNGQSSGSQGGEQAAAHSAASPSAGASHAHDGAAQLLSRKLLLDLRDALRSFLTLLERR